MSEPLRIGPYAVERVLGRGGMGVVYAARDERLGRLVALKLLAAGFDDERAAARLRREAEALGRLRHPGVVPVHDFFLWQGRPCLVLEFVPGGSLEARLRAEGGLPLGDALRVLSAVADAVAAAHASGLLHRDLKAANVLLRSDGRAVVTDFGLARELASARERLTRTGELLGTPGSMAPEQARGGEVDERTDVYGLGALLFEALTGRPPFVGKSPLAVLDQVVRAPAPAPSELRAGLPPAVDRLCARALAKSPEDRPQSAREFAAALRALAAGGEASPAARRRSLLVAAALLGCSGAVGVLALWDAPGRSEAALAPPSAGGEGPGG
ncbi:MAG: serine/threonine protein kinase, partial [Planctomycetota bacterium]